MGQTLCTETQLGKNRTTLQCSFVEWSILKNLAEPSTDNWIPVYFSGGALICLLLLWILSFSINYRDFTRSFVIGQLVPYTVTYLTRFILDLYQRLSTSSQIYVYSTTDSSRMLSQANKVAITASGLNLPLGTVIFLLTSIYAASSRKKLGCCTVWMPYFLCLVLSLAGGSVFSYLGSGANVSPSTYDTFAFVYTLAVRICILFSLLLVFVILCVLCCCSRPRIGQSRDPTVSNARSRMVWTIPFVFVSLFPLTYGTTVTDLFYTISKLLFGTSAYGNRFFVLYHTFILVDMLDPFLLTLSILLFLPAYRSTFCGSQGYSSQEPFEVVKPAPQIKIPLPVTPPARAPTVRPPAPPANNEPTQIGQIMQPAGRYDANLVTMLTTPSAMYAHSPLPGSVPQVCSCQSTAFLTTPAYQMVQQPVFQQSAMCPHHQGNILRFASQPNLLQPAAIHPSASMPALSMVHTTSGPFYIQA